MLETKMARLALLCIASVLCSSTWAGKSLSSVFYVLKFLNAKFTVAKDIISFIRTGTKLRAFIHFPVSNSHSRWTMLGPR